MTLDDLKLLQGQIFVRISRDFMISEGNCG